MLGEIARRHASWIGALWFGALIHRAGDPGVMIPAGLPMILVGGSNGLRRSLVLILQDATQPRSTPATDWAPAGLCTRSRTLTSTGLHEGLP